jgi:hypothetical protein
VAVVFGVRDSPSNVAAKRLFGSPQRTKEEIYDLSPGNEATDPSPNTGKWGLSLAGEECEGANAPARRG